MSEQDWTRVFLEAGASLVSGAAGIVAGVWRAGRASAKREQAVKDDYTVKIGALEEDMRQAIAAHELASRARLDLLVEQFKESFIGIRRTIDDDRLHTEREFLRKDDFRDFRDEYREDMKEIKDSIKEIASKS